MTVRYLRLSAAAKELGLPAATLRKRGEVGTHDTRPDPDRPTYRLYAVPVLQAEDSEDPELLDWDELTPVGRVGADEPIEDLIERRVETYRRAHRQEEQRRAVTRIRRDGPFGVVHFGDPHVDDDGCDWPALLRDVETVQNTDGLYAGNVGDTVNNWVGKLVAKWRQQSSTEDEAFRLGRWLFQVIPWDYVVLGNHDHWNQGGALFREFARDAQIGAIVDHEARIEYIGPGGGTFRLCVRHDFKGHSMWNNVHGPLKRSKMRAWADLYVCGHKHTWGLHSEEVNGDPAHVLRVRGYKRMDEYADAKDFSEDAHGCSLTTVIDPDHPHPGERCKVFHDVEEAAAYLGWLRSR